MSYTLLGCSATYQTTVNISPNVYTVTGGGAPNPAPCANRRPSAVKTAGPKTARPKTASDAAISAPRRMVIPPEMRCHMGRPRAQTRACPGPQASHLHGSSRLRAGVSRFGRLSAATLVIGEACSRPGLLPLGDHPWVRRAECEPHGEGAVGGEGECACSWTGLPTWKPCEAAGAALCRRQG